MKRVIRFLRRLRGDEGGVTAVEFAFIAPVMILFYFGLAEYSRAMIAERRTVRTASAIGDLIAQANGAITATGSGSVTEIFGIASELMKPYPTSSTTLQMCVASILANSTNTQNKVVWSRNQNDTTCPAKNAVITSVPADLISANESVIYSRVTYKYAGVVNQVIKTNPTFTKTFYLRPRRSAQITCSTC